MVWKITPSFATQWTPANITTALWLDAADDSTVTTVSGAVSQWNDKSGNGRNATQGTSASRPAYTSNLQNGLPGIVFDGSNDWMESASVKLLPDSTTQYILAAVASIGSSKSLGSLFMHSYATGSRNFGLQRDANGTVNCYAGNGTSNYLQYNAGAQTQIYCAVYNAGLLLRINGSAVTGTVREFSPSASINGTTGTFTIGRTLSGYELNAQLYELVIVPSINAVSTYTAIEGYMAWKWGLVAGLPSGHPYKVNPPAP